MAIDATSWTAIENGAYFRQLGTMITGFAGGRTDPAAVVTSFEGMKNGLDEIVSELTTNYSENFAKKIFLFSQKDDYETLKRRTDSAKDGFNTLYLLLGKTNVDKIVPPIKVDVGYEGVRKKEEELEKLIEDRDVLNADLKAKKKELSDKRSVLNKTFKPAEKKKLKDEVASLSKEIADIEKKIKDSEKKIKDMEKEVGDMRKAMKQAASEQNAARATAGTAHTLDPAVNARLQYSNLVKCIEVGLKTLKDLQKQLGTVKMKDDTKGKAFDTGAIVDKSVLKAFGLRSDSAGTQDMLKAMLKKRLDEVRRYIVKLSDELEESFNEVSSKVKKLKDDLGIDFYKTTILKNREKEYDKYNEFIIKSLNEIEALLKSDDPNPVVNLMPKGERAFIREVDESADNFKKIFERYKDMIRARYAFADVLNKCYVFDANMGIDHKAVENGNLEKLRYGGYGVTKVHLEQLPLCLPVAKGEEHLVSQYRHMGSSKPYIVIDKHGNIVGDDKDGPYVKNGDWLCINRDISDEQKGLREVEKVLQASLKAGKWVKLADIK